MARAIDLASDVLPTPGGPTKQMIEPFGLLDELAHGEELEDALLDLLEAVVVLVEDLLGAVDVLDLLAWSSSRERRPATRCSCARPWPRRRHRRHRLQALELLLGLLLRLLGHAGLLRSSARSSSTSSRAVVLAPQLLVDGLDLLVEVVLLLGLLHLLLDLDVDPLVDVDLLDLDVEQVLQASAGARRD